jgi:heptosyltransferase-1
MQEAGIAGRPVAILAPFTTRPQKHWVEERWPTGRSALGRRLPARDPGRAGRPGRAERIASQEPRIVNLTGRLKLDETVAAIAQGQLLIGVDTGLTHMGIALGLPTVALFGSTAPYLHAGTRRVRVLYKALPCSPCHRPPPAGDNSTA